MLIAAFRATLEEVLEADIILHVRDIAASESDAQRADVLMVLKELGIATEGPECPILEVWNKADLLTPERREELLHRARRETLGAMVVSAVTGDGVSELLEAVDARIGQRDRSLTLDVDPGQGAFLSWLHENSEVLERAMTDEGRYVLKLRIDATRRGRLDARLAAIGPESARLVEA